MSLLALLVVFGNAQAIEYAQMLSIDTLVHESDEVAQGTVRHTSSEWGSDGLIYTRVSLDTNNSLQSWKDPTVTFLVPGGTVDDVELTIPGGPQFELGDEVLVFLSGGRLFGLGQGSFRVEEGIATRTLGSSVEQASVRSVFGDPQEARSCTREKLLGAYEENWSLRRSTMLRLGADDARALEVTLMAGVEYAVQLCGDGMAIGSWVGVFDDSDQLIAESEMQGSSGVVRLEVPETGTYWISAHNDNVQDGWTTSLDVAIQYR